LCRAEEELIRAKQPSDDYGTTINWQLILAMKLLSLEARKSAAAAISSGRQIPQRGVMDVK